MKTQTYFITDDGKKFNSKEAAEKHEKELSGTKDDARKLEISEKVAENNIKMNTIRDEIDKLLDRLDELDAEFDKVKNENEKLFKEYNDNYASDAFKSAYKTLMDIFDKIKGE